MKRIALASPVVLCLLLSPAVLFGHPKSQAQQASGVAQAAPTSTTPAAPAKWVRPIKGTATIEIIQGAPKKIGGDMVTVLKIRNTSSGAIALLKLSLIHISEPTRPY